MPNDPKWRTIARISGQRIGDVQAVYMHLLTSASQNVTRGHADVTAEDLASAIDVTDEAVQSILDAMQGRVLEGMKLTGWEKRQPKREDSGNEESGAKSSAERKRLQREREKAAQESDAENQCHAASRNVTLDKDKDTDKEEDISSGSSPIPTMLTESGETKTKAVNKTIPDCPHADILALWAEKLPVAIQPADWNEKRQHALRSRWREKANRQKLDWWSRFFEYIGESDFLMGRTNTPGRKAFALSLDWLCKSDNFLKVIEGRFHEQEGASA